MKSEIVKASEMQGLCLRIFALRHPEKLPGYRKELRKYERKLAASGNKEAVFTKSDGLFGETKKTGFVEIVKGLPVYHYRPLEPTPRAYGRFHYDRSYGSVTHAKTFGLLADAQFNREIREDRVERYAEEMRAGRWRDLYSDPISITTEGQVLNGEHRIAAAGSVDWEQVDGDPGFLVLWDVEPAEAQFADRSKRTLRDERTISDKLLSTANGSPGNGLVDQR